MTISMCRKFCKDKQYTYSYLYESDECFCSNEKLSTKKGDKSCGTHCAGNSDEVCGGDNAISVYDGRFLINYLILNFFMVISLLKSRR